MRLLTAVIGTALFATTAWPQATLPEWSLTPLLRIGSIDGPDALSYIGPIVVSPVSGTIFAAETTQNILAFSADGAFLRRFGQPGQGPGEFQTLRTISWANGEVYAFDLSLRVSRFTEEGVVIETRAMEPEPLGPMNRRARPVASLQGGNYLGVGTLSSVNEGPRVGIDEEYLASVNTAGEAKILDTLHRLTEMVRVPPVAYMPVPMLPTSQYAVHPDGSRIVIVHQNYPVTGTTGFFRVRLITPDGNVVFARNYEYEPRLIPSAFITAHLERMRPGLERNGSSIRDAERALSERISRHEPAVYEVLIGVDQTIWLRRESNDTAPGRGLDWWILDPQGNLIAQARLPFRFSPKYFDGVTLIGVERDDLDVFYIVQYRLNR